MIDNLIELRERMLELTNDNCDIESSHQIADDLLLDALLTLSNKDNKDIIQDIINYFIEVEKWYA